MPEQRLPPTIAELERALTELGAHLEHPPTPDLATAVRRRIDAAPVPGQRRVIPTWAWGAKIAALVLFVLAVSAVALFPGAGSAIADRLGLGGIRIFYTPALPTVTPSPIPTITPLALMPATTTSEATLTASPTSTPAPLGAGLRLGVLISLDAARARVPFTIRMPTAADLGPPDELYLGSPPASGQVALVYRARATLPAAETGVGLLLTEFQADLATEFFGKGIGPGTTLEQIKVNGEPGYWISGAPHFFFYFDPAGNIHDEPFRLATSSLLWEHDGVTFRVEANLSRSEAIRIAESVR